MSRLSYQRVKDALLQRGRHAASNRKWKQFNADAAKASTVDPDLAPVIFFNASTRLEAVSQNAAYSFLASKALNLEGVPVLYYVCAAGMQRCVLGSKRDDVDVKPPCSRCVNQSMRLYDGADVCWFEDKTYPELDAQLEGQDVGSAESFEYQGVPLGKWAANSLRWVLRKHHLSNDDPTRKFFHYFIHSAWNVYAQFKTLVEEKHPQAVVLFNGMFYPEAAARYVCTQLGIRVITHEVGMLPYTAFFTPGEATAYPIHISPDFKLDDAMNARLDEYLEQRMQGNFSMAGIRFWPEIKGLSSDFLALAAQFDQIVPVFTNVIFDTSQVHANTIFPDMFAWLQNVQKAVQTHPRTLFVIRAHPDEGRAGKESRESVAQWVRRTSIDRLPNVVFVDSGEYISSYDLIQRSRFVMVYNSTIGLEASIMGKAVLAGGKARFTQLPTSYFPQGLYEYEQRLEQLLSAKAIEVPAEFRENARRFLYYQLFVTSLPFDEWIEEDGVWKGYVRLKDFPVYALESGHSATMKAIVNGILHDGNFELEQ